MGPNSLPVTDYLAPLDRDMHSQLTPLASTHPKCDMCVLSPLASSSHTTCRAPIGM